MNDSSPSRPARIDSLTWLRGLAAFVVLLFHVKRATNVSYFDDDEPAQYLLMELLDLGNFGVLLFFVVSGVTLFINNRQLSSKSEFWVFFVKRFFRIWPAFFVSMIVFLLFMPVFEHFYLAQKTGLWIEVHASSYSVVDVLLYLALVFNLTGPAELFNIVYWSLPIEFQYYILFPLILVSIKYLSYFGPILVGGICYLGFSLDLGQFIENELTLLFAYTFCGGVLIGFLHERFGNRFNLSPLSAILLIAPVLALLSLIEAGLMAIPTILQPLPIIGEGLNWQGFSAIFVVLVVLFTRCDTPLVKREGRAYRMLMHYGEVSYSIYLYHMLFAATAVLIIINLGITSALGKLLFTLIFTFIGSFLLADWSYRWVELKGVGYGRKVVRRIRTGSGGKDAP